MFHDLSNCVHVCVSTPFDCPSRRTRLFLPRHLVLGVFRASPFSLKGNQQETSRVSVSILTPQTPPALRFRVVPGFSAAEKEEADMQRAQLEQLEQMKRTGFALETVPVPRNKGRNPQGTSVNMASNHF